MEWLKLESNVQLGFPRSGCNRVNPYTPGVLFVGHRQTVQTQIRCRTMRCLIRVSTVCLQNVLLKFDQKQKIQPNTPKIGNGFLLLIRVDRFTFIAPITTAADDKFCEIFPNFRNKKMYDIS